MTTQPLVLVADDEPRITKLVSLTLVEAGYRVVTAATGGEALEHAARMRPDLVILDLMLPDRDGYEVMLRLREMLPVPVIILTARGAVADRATGLDMGADDYIAKPFHPDELAARVRAVLRRAAGPVSARGVVRVRDVLVDLDRRTVTRDGEIVPLSRTEWLLLQQLAINAGRVVLHTELLAHIWGQEYVGDVQYLRVWMSRLRRKLGIAPGQPGPIRTYPGIGYLLEATVERPPAF